MFDEIGCVDIGCIQIDDYYFLLVSFPFYYYGMSFLILFDQCRFEVYFVRDKYFYSCLFSEAIGLVNLLPAFHPKLMFISASEMGLLQATIVGSSFLIHFIKWCLLMWELSPLTLSVSTDRYVVIPVI
jgi:hypothetical protein